MRLVGRRPAPCAAGDDRAVPTTCDRPPAFKSQLLRVGSLHRRAELHAVVLVTVLHLQLFDLFLWFSLPRPVRTSRPPPHPPQPSSSSMRSCRSAAVDGTLDV